MMSPVARCVRCGIIRLWELSCIDFLCVMKYRLYQIRAVIVLCSNVEHFPTFLIRISISKTTRHFITPSPKKGIIRSL